jgi:hypothetical protein
MANSKSSIYPIQLKNAELNLNKYDAEIKQYTGFNKNNAPFVGGCLSNLFVKDNTISGSTNDNTYIDDNGDVYKTEIKFYGYPYGYYFSLLKNNQTLFMSNQNKFFVNKELSFPKDTIRVLTEDLYIIKSVNGVYTELYLKSKSDSTLNVFIVRLSQEWDIDEYVKGSITNIFVNQGNYNYCVIAYVAGRVLGLIVINTDTNGYFVQRYTDVVGGKGGVTLCYDENSTKQFSLFRNAEPDKIVDFFTIDFINESVTHVNPDFGTINAISANQTLSSGVKLVPYDLKAYHLLNYPSNRAILIKQSDIGTTITSSTAFKIAGGLSIPYYDDGLKFRIVTAMDYPVIKTVATSSYIKLDQSKFNNRTTTPLMCCCDIQNAVSVNYQETTNFDSWCVHQNSMTYYFNGFNFSDYKEELSGNTIKVARYSLGDYIAVGKGVFRFAFNNNLLSAICGQNTLLTEWNSINAEDVYFYNDYRASKKIYDNFDERIIYKLNDKWFIIKLDLTPSLSVFENQLVINADILKNSYDKKRDRFLHFAVNYNSLKDYTQRQAINSFYNLLEQENDIIVAGAINEYEQENNSSIILNPISIARVPDANYLDGNIHFVGNGSDYVNIYSDLYTGNSVIDYMYSVLDGGSRDSKFYFKDNLLNMPFPIDVNGNVEYNVNLFSKIKSTFGNAALIQAQLNSYPLVIGNNNNFLMNYYLASGVEGLEELFVIQGNYYGVMQGYIVSLSYYNGVISNIQFIVSVEGLQFCGNTPYQAIFFSKTNRCLYAFTGANVLNVMQTIDKINEVRDYKYNPATQSIFLITDTGVIINGLFGTYQIDYLNITKIFLLNNGFVLNDGSTAYRYIKYYKDIDDGYTKQNIELDTCFYGMDNQTVTINDCLYLRLFSEEHEEGSLEVSAVTLSLKGRKTEKTTFKIKAGDWDKETHTIYLRYQPKEQRGLGISFKINSPFKIASMSVGSQPDAILIDKVSKGAVNAPLSTSSNINW